MKIKSYMCLFSVLFLGLACQPTPELVTPTPMQISALSTQVAAPLTQVAAPLTQVAAPLTQVAAPSPSLTPDVPRTPALPPPTQSLLSPEQAAHWQHYPSYNYVRDLAFSPSGGSFPDDTLWAAIMGGVVQWDLTTDTPIYHELPGGESGRMTYQIAIAQNSVWVATGNGVARFEDGLWHTYTMADGLPANAVYALTIASEGKIWVGTGDGLAMFDGTTWTAYQPESAPSDTLIWYIAVADSGTVWASTHGDGLWRYEPASDTWTIYRDEFPFPNARALAISPSGVPWMHVGYDNVYYFNGDTWELGYESTGGRWVCDMAFPDGTETPYIATCDGYHTSGTGLAYFDGDAWDYITIDDGLVRNSLSTVALSKDGVVAVGMDRAISVRQNGVWRTLRYGPTLREVTASAVTPNGTPSLDGAVWFGFGDTAPRPQGGGIARFDGTRWQYFDDETMFPAAHVRVLTVSPTGDLWGSAGCNIIRWVGEQWQSFATCDDVLGNVLMLAFSPNGDLWAATDFDLYQFVGASLDNRVAHNAKIPVSLAIPVDGTVWVNRATIAEGGGGLQMFDGTEWLTPTTTFEHADLFVDVVGDLWVTHSQGVARFDGTTWTHYNPGLPNARGILTMAFSPDNVPWAITLDQLLFWDGDQWQSVALPIAAALHTLSAAPDGSLWLGTDQGALHYHP